jgi:transmembrane sensor
VQTTRPESADAVEAQAARWLARHQAGPLAGAEAEAFAAWCDADPRRLGAYVRLEAVDARLDRARILDGDSVRRARRPASLPAAAAAVAAAIGLAVWPAWLMLHQGGESRQLSTALGEQYRTALQDGSLVELNTSTRLAVRLRPHERAIRLKSGEALFEVAHDRSRPFVVHTDYGDVRAVGTVFSVSTLGGLKVSVSQGLVAVERRGQEIGRVAAGETFSVSPSGDVARRGGQAQEIQRSLAWREGDIVLAGETLQQAAQAFNRYNRVQLRIADPKAAGMHVGGSFRATDPEGFASALERALPVTARQSEGVISIAARGSGDS